MSNIACGQSASTVQPTVPSKTVKRLLLVFLIMWFGFQILFPVRHFLYPGNVSWTEEGHRFSWRMKLRSKRSQAIFTIQRPDTNEEWVVEPKDYLFRHQASAVASRPDMILQYAHFLEEIFNWEYKTDNVQVRAHVCVSLNGRPPALMIDPDRDLTKVKFGIRHSDWILPLEVPFERPERRRGRRDLDC